MVLKIVILGLTFTYFIRGYAASFAQLVRADAEAGLWVTSKMTLWMWGILLLLTALFAVVDYSMQYRHLRKQLMMSHEDIKQEFKNAEGSPEIKQRRRELHREIQSGSLADSVSSASVVVRNPTHIAVCLRYCEGRRRCRRWWSMGAGRGRGISWRWRRRGAFPWWRIFRWRVR